MDAANRGRLLYKLADAIEADKTYLTVSVIHVYVYTSCIDNLILANI